MTCYHPTPASQDHPGAAVRLWRPMGEGNLSLPCGTCVGCRTDRASDWAHRCVHEASCWEKNVFVTLTYSDENLPKDFALQPRELQLFIKRLRKLHDRVRYFACGEYGSISGRPHYHALLFNCDFPDAVRCGADLYDSASLGRLWPFGQCKFGGVTAASANYVAQYSLKKIGAAACDANGVVRQPPFLRMSTRPAIGEYWRAKYKEDLRYGYLVVGGRRVRIPRYYRKALESKDPMLADAIRERISKLAVSDRNVPARLEAGELIDLQRVERSRSFEKSTF